MLVSSIAGRRSAPNCFFLHNTTMPAMLIETCFVDSETDDQIYRSHFEEVCDAISDVLGGEDMKVKHRRRVQIST